MSSTEETNAREVLGKFFDEVLSPLSARMQASGQEAFPLGPNPDCQSYFVARPQAAMTREDFVAPSCQDFGDFESRLHAHWKVLGRTELLGEVGRVNTLAQAAHAARAHAGESHVLSSDMYVMF